MNKITKRFISFFLSLTMIFSVTMLGFAQEVSAEPDENWQKVTTIVGEISPDGQNTVYSTNTNYIINTSGEATSSSTIYGTGSAGSGQANTTLICGFTYRDGNGGSCTLKLGHGWSESDWYKYSINCDGKSRVIARNLDFSRDIPVQWEITGHRAGLIYVIRMYY